MLKLSVVVPVYNVEKYLPRCLDSLLRQGLEPGEWEVVCVNDGSPDHSAAILAEYEKKYPNIFKVITQENQGSACARDVGTALAQGEFVTYLDSDDYLVDGAYRYLLDHFCGDGEKEGGEKVKLDVLHYNYRYVYTDGKTLFDPDAKPDGTISFEGDGVEIFNRDRLSYVWSKFYRRAFLEENHIESVESEKIICQDMLFNFKVFCYHPYTRVVTSSIVRYENSNVVSIQKTTNKKVVYVQLNDIYYDMDVIQHYLDEGHTDLLPAAHRTLSQLQEIYYNKMIRTDLKYDDWKRCTMVLNVKRKSESLMNVKSGLTGRALGRLKMMAGHSYMEYLFVRFLYRTIFLHLFFDRIYK